MRLADTLANSLPLLSIDLSMPRVKLDSAMKWWCTFALNLNLLKSLFWSWLDLFHKQYVLEWVKETICASNFTLVACTAWLFSIGLWASDKLNFMPNFNLLLLSSGKFMHDMENDGPLYRKNYDEKLQYIKSWYLMSVLWTVYGSFHRVSVLFYYSEGMGSVLR